jgi:hypothetical protein
MGFMRPLILALVVAAFSSGVSVAAEAVVKKIRNFPKFAGHSIQGMGITADGHLIQGYNHGFCRIYDLKRDEPVPVAEFAFGSSGKDNHANAVALGAKPAEGSDFPLVYVTGGQPANGLMECHVERIGKKDGIFHAERIQKISLAPGFAWDMKPSSVSKTADGFQKIWGAPSWLVDEEGGCIYIFSAIYRTTAAYAAFGDVNRYVVTKLRLPGVAEGDVTLERKDVLDQTTYDFDAFITQSGCLEGSAIYYTFGFGRGRGSRESSQLRIYDLEARTITGSLDLAEAIPEELEGCDFHQGKLLVMTQKGNLFEVELPAK